MRLGLVCRKLDRNHLQFVLAPLTAVHPRNLLALDLHLSKSMHLRPETKVKTGSNFSGRSWRLAITTRIIPSNLAICSTTHTTVHPSYHEALHHPLTMPT
ncbi:hypothetical protein BKA93DRAFT_353854 [Sparassis latifolia]